MTKRWTEIWDSEKGRWTNMWIEMDVPVQWGRAETIDQKPPHVLDRAGHPIATSRVVGFRKREP